MSRVDIDTGTEHLLAYEDNGVAVITLNRPQARNAMSNEMTAGLAEALDVARAVVRASARWSSPGPAARSARAGM